MKDAESVYEEMKRDLAEAHRAGGLLERNWLREMKWREAAEAQRDALLAALHEMLEGFVDSYCHNDPDYSKCVQ